MIEIDGSFGEGGGQILRNAISFSAVIGKSIRIYNIRAKRTPPGLRPQHATAVKAVAEIVNAKVEGLDIGSREIFFYPGEKKSGKFFFDAGTAASTILILQSLMPVMAFSNGKIEVELRGGTNNPLAPPIEYLKEVLLPILRRMGYKGDVELIKRGFYPKGQGIVKAFSIPVDHLKSIELTDFGKVEYIKGLSYSSLLPDHIVKRMAQSAKQLLENAGYKNVDIELEALQKDNPKCSLSPGCGIILYAYLSSNAIVASDILGKLGKPAEKVGFEAANELIKQLNTKSPVDKHLGDQLIIWISLAEGLSRIKVSEFTLHTLTSIEVCKKLIGANFKIDGKLGESALITCNGVGLKNLNI